MTVKPYSWKQKIDPAFDRFIKFYLEFLQICQLPGNEGYLSLEIDEKQLKKLETQGFPSIAPFYEHDKYNDVVSAFSFLIGDPLDKQEIRTIKKQIETENNAYELLIDTIPNEDSRDYYRKSFEPLQNDQEYRKHSSNMDERNLKKWQRKIYSDIVSLQWHAVIETVDQKKKEIEKEREGIRDRYKLLPKVFTRNIFHLWNTVSLLVNKKPLKDLFVEARKGSDESLFKLIRVDKTLFDHDWFRMRIRKAAYSGDWQFFESLSKAIKTDPLSNRKVLGDVFLILTSLWKVGLYRLTIPELMQLLKDSGMRMIYDEINFRKFVDREIKPRFKNW